MAEASRRRSVLKILSVCVVAFVVCTQFYVMWNIRQKLIGGGANGDDKANGNTKDFKSIINLSF